MEVTRVRAMSACEHLLVVTGFAPWSPWLCSAQCKLAPLCPILLHVTDGSLFDEGIDA